MKIQSQKTFELLFLPLLIAIAFSAFIYWEYFHLSSKIVNTLFGLGGLYGLLHAPRRTLPIAGFWIGLLWCYWIGYSFQYYGLGWAETLVALGFGLVYALYFGSMGLTSNPWLRALILFGLTYIWPMDFNWMQPELIFVESYIGFEKWQFALTLAAIASTALFSQWKKLLPLFIILFAVQPSHASVIHPQVRIKLVSTDISQDLKWQEFMMGEIIRENLRQIDLAIDQRYDLVVLPESAFVLYMNHHPALQSQLQQRSQSIAILTGTLHEENSLHYNVSYLFDKGKITVAKKTILVPFGEYIPLPDFLQDWVNREIFAGGSNFVTADKPTDFLIKGVKFRNAICYEATREELYTPDARYMIAISNNGWFKPSIEPTLQNLLIRFYARKNGSMVFHAANGGGSGVVY
ncbi:MAG TPA: apolipoprotein N-acyltransferase [Sulfuricurvum sp.]|nr:apolipoprotein N-acyltransferase [Sulfuricurvum sp.]